MTWNGRGSGSCCMSDTMARSRRGCDRCDVSERKSPCHLRSEGYHRNSRSGPLIPDVGASSMNVSVMMIAWPGGFYIPSRSGLLEGISHPW